MPKIIADTRERIAGLRERFDRYRQPLKTYWPATFFTSGFLFDILTLGRIDNLLNILSHALYLLVVLAALLTQILELKAGPTAGRLTAWFFAYRDDGVHFLLGALLSAFAIFFFKSGTLVNTGLLLTLLATLLVINEMPFFQARGVALKMVLFIISLCSFFIYLVPVLLGRISSAIFLLSLSCGLLVLLGVWHFLLRAGVGASRLRRVLLLPAGAVVLGFVVLYWARMIPPVPLSLLQIGIYHNLEREEGVFRLYRETSPWRFWTQGDQDFQAREGDRLYLFCRIFAPGGFRDGLYFNFQYFDEQRGWQSTDRIPLTIVGGRDAGFRGYAYKSNYREGRWRALVETTEALEIGRVAFRVQKSLNTNPRNFYLQTY